MIRHGSWILYVPLFILWHAKSWFHITYIWLYMETLYQFKFISWHIQKGHVSRVCHVGCRFVKTRVGHAFDTCQIHVWHMPSLSRYLDMCQWCWCLFWWWWHGGLQTVAVMLILMMMTWRQTINSQELWDSSIHGSSNYPILYLPLAFLPIVAMTQYLCNTFWFLWLNEKMTVYGSNFLCLSFDHHWRGVLVVWLNLYHLHANVLVSKF